MKHNERIKRISSKYIIQNIFEYIKDDTIKFKLFTYSKEFQNKLDINQLNYLGKYLTKKNFNIFKYFSFNHDYYMKQPINIGNKEDLKIFFENELIKYNISFKKYFLYLYQFFSNNVIYKNSFIDIFSPYFDLFLYYIPLAFRWLFIPIVIETIEKQDLKNDFINAFDKIKQTDIEEISICFNFNKTNDIDFLKKMAMDYKIKRFIVRQNHLLENEKNNNYDDFLKELFTFNLIDTLISLNISINKSTISPKSLEKLNDLKILQNLELVNLIFNDTFILKLKNLKTLYICECQNITFIEDSFLNLEELYALDCYINIPKSLMRMPNIKVCLLRSKYYIIEDYVSIFDYTSMINILELDIGLNEFLDLDCSLYKNLYYLKINFNYYDINHNHYLKKMFIQLELKC